MLQDRLERVGDPRRGRTTDRPEPTGLGAQPAALVDRAVHIDEDIAEEGHQRSVIGIGFRS
jgi:hypothetical protein